MLGVKEQALWHEKGFAEMAGASEGNLTGRSSISSGPNSARPLGSARGLQQAEWQRGEIESLKREVEALRQRGGGLQAQVRAAEKDQLRCSRASAGALSRASTAFGCTASASSGSLLRSLQSPSPPRGGCLRHAEERERLRAQTLELEERYRQLEREREALLGCAGHVSGAMGWMATTRFITKGARSKGRNAYFRKFEPAHRQWGMMKDLLNQLVMQQRLEMTLPKAKELQQYAEEIVFLAKKNTDYHDSQVEGMLTSPEARQILYERLVPRYQNRHFHVTRVVNMFKLRERDTAPLGLIEYVDRPGELRPANPVGAARVQEVAHEFLESRRGRRKHLSEMQRILARPREPPLDAGVLERCRFECAKYGALPALSGGSAAPAAPQE